MQEKAQEVATPRRTLALRSTVAGALALGLLLASASPASAAHHLVRINEVFPGTTMDPNAEYVELKLTAQGENLVNGTQVRFYAASGTERTPAAFTATAMNGQNQRTILVGTPAAENLFTVQTDLEYPDSDRIDPAGGAACFDSPSLFGGVDCVSWGTFPPATVLPDGTGSTPHGTPEPGPISPGSSLERSMAPGCPTLLEIADDTNDSATDFSYVDPQTPRNNAAAAEGAACTTLQVNRAGTGSGSVSGNGSPAIACPGSCFAFFTPADTATLTATPDPISTFSGWTNCPTPTGNQCDAPMNMSRTITANFQVTGGGGGTPIPPAQPVPFVQTNPSPPPKCKKGQKLKKGKCVKKRRKKPR